MKYSHTNTNGVLCSLRGSHKNWNGEMEINDSPKPNDKKKRVDWRSCAVLRLWTYIYIYMCVCVCVCVWSINGMIMRGRHRDTECHLVHHKSHMDCLEVESSLRRQTVRTMALAPTATGHVFISDGSAATRRGCISKAPVNRSQCVTCRMSI